MEELASRILLYILFAVNFHLYGIPIVRLSNFKRTILIVYVRLLSEPGESESESESRVTEEREDELVGRGKAECMIFYFRVLLASTR